MHRIRYSIFYTVALFLLVAPSARADVTATFFSETVQTWAYGGSFPTDHDELTNSMLPPVSIQITSQAGVSSFPSAAEAAVAISSYSGPLTVGASAPELSIIGSTAISGSGSWDAGATLWYKFTLDRDQAYSFTGGPFLTELHFILHTTSGSTEYAPGSSGILAPGNYELFAGRGPSNFNLTITPEPAMSAILILSGGLLLTRIRSPMRRVAP